MKLSAEEIGLLVQKAYVLEATADKPGCTTRYKDLEGKPLEDFLIAGINVGPVFADFAREWINNPSQSEVFSHQLTALKASVAHKSDKYISMGLIELMFPFIAARIRCNDPNKVIAEAKRVLARAPQKDVQNLINVRKVGWKKSKNATEKLKELKTDIVHAKSPAEFYEQLAPRKDLVPAAYQWGQHFVDGYPFIREQFEYLQGTSGPLLPRIKQAFIPVYEKNRDIKIGILADSSAVAIFLHLSFI